MIPPIVRRFVAGETSAEAIAHGIRLNDCNIGVIFNLTGDYYSDPALVTADRRTYRQLIDDITGTNLRACLSIKPTQLGLCISAELFLENIEMIVKDAYENDLFVWLDMEDHTAVDATIDAFEHCARRYGNIGICLQANLERTAADLRRVSQLPGAVRLVKGAYAPPSDIGCTDTEQITRRMKALLEYTFDRFDSGVALGSHDPELLEYAGELSAEYGTPYELQTMMGFRTPEEDELAANTERWQYVPFGEKWANAILTSYRVHLGRLLRESRILPAVDALEPRCYPPN